jgi:hypothetical protein
MEGGAVGHNFERDPPKDHPCQVWCNLVQQFRRKRFKCDLYQNMPNLHIRYKSAERKISQKNPEYVTHCHVAAVKFKLILIYNKAAMDN